MVGEMLALVIGAPLWGHAALAGAGRTPPVSASKTLVALRDIVSLRKVGAAQAQGQPPAVGRDPALERAAFPVLGLARHRDVQGRLDPTVPPRQGCRPPARFQ